MNIVTKPFDTSTFFSGGAGMFLQYHDVVKPVYLYAILKMIIDKVSYGLPIDIIQNMSIFSIIEWYVNRRYINPLRSLDFAHVIDPEELDALMKNILRSDKSLYQLAPTLNIQRKLSSYKRHRMTFPIYVYSKEEEPYIIQDCQKTFEGLPVKYLHGDLREAIRTCEQNFTYILSDIDTLKEVADILLGSFSHVLLAREYRYNYSDNCKTFRYNLTDIMDSRPFVRIGVTDVIDFEQMIVSFRDTMLYGGTTNASS